MAAVKFHREVVGDLSAHAHDDSARGLKVDYIHHALEAEFVEVETVAHIVVGRHGLGIIVDHDRLVTELAAGVGGVDRTPVKLNRATDAIGSRTEHYNVVAGVHVVADGVFISSVSHIQIVGEVGVFRCHGIDASYARHDVKRLAVSAHAKYLLLHAA